MIEPTFELDKSLSNPENRTFLGEEILEPDQWQRFTAAVQRLAVQGERFQHKETKTEMTAFVGRFGKGKDIVDIQIQNGQDVQQLIIRLFGKATSYQLEINHLHQGGFDIDVEKFSKGVFQPAVIEEIQTSYPRRRVISKIYWGQAGTKDDFMKLTEVLESTTLDEKLFEKVVQYIKRHGDYKQSVF